MIGERAWSKTAHAPSVSSACAQRPHRCKSQPGRIQHQHASSRTVQVHAAAAQATTQLVVATSPQANDSSPQSQAFVRVANLASAWSKVSRHLQPSTAGSEDVGCIIRAIRLAMVALEGYPPRRDGRDPFGRAIVLAVTLAELSAVGLPLDADGIAAAVVADAVGYEEWGQGWLDHGAVRLKLGDSIASLVHDILRVRTAPQRVELYDDTAASAIREWCIAAHDVRACVVEVVSRWDELQHMTHLPLYEQQQMALEALQVYAPLGHALGMGAVSASMEDACFRVLFPESYSATHQWLREVVDPAEDALYAAQQQLLRVLEQNPQFTQLADSCVLRARTKSLFSMMKKLLRLGDMDKGGRRPEEVFDLLGMRAIVQPRQDLPAEQAEQLAVQACYVMKEVAEQLWRVMPKRTKDYIQHPKPNGYRCLHLTVCMDSVIQATQQQSTQQGPGTTVQGSGAGSSSDTATEGQQRPGRAPFMELQIRTQRMDERAESGDAAHTAYKGGLDARQARQLQLWSQELHARLAIKPQGKLLLPPSVLARQSAGALESIDLESDLSQSDSDGCTSPAGTDPAVISPRSSSGGGGAPDTSGLRVIGTDVTLAVAPQGSSQGGRSAAFLAAEQLFKEFDSNGDGRISLQELKEQLREVAVGVQQSSVTWYSAGVGVSSVGGGYWGQVGYGGYGVYSSLASFDDEGSGVWVHEPAGGVTAAAAGVGMYSGSGEVLAEVSGASSSDLSGSELERLQRALAGEHEVDMSLEEFAVFLKQADALRKRAREMLQHRAPHSA